jgi:hypothetical protein
MLVGAGVGENGSDMGSFTESYRQNEEMLGTFCGFLQPPTRVYQC